MTHGAQRDQVLFRILPQMAAKFFVVNLQVRHRAVVHQFEFHSEAPPIAPHD